MTRPRSDCGWVCWLWGAEALSSAGSSSRLDRTGGRDRSCNRRGQAVNHGVRALLLRLCDRCGRTRNKGISVGFGVFVAELSPFETLIHPASLEASRTRGVRCCRRKSASGRRSVMLGARRGSSCRLLAQGSSSSSGNSVFDFHLAFRSCTGAMRFRCSKADRWSGLMIERQDLKGKSWSPCDGLLRAAWKRAAL